jgi:hypothetical protein
LPSAGCFFAKLKSAMTSSIIESFAQTDRLETPPRTSNEAVQELRISTLKKHKNSYVMFF